jgi:arginyl-tRNA synthetase
LIPAPLRTQVREAIARAWDAAIESGGLPALPDDVAPPAIEVEHPADPTHGDLATNLAMKLARPSRKAPLEIATLLAAKLVRDASADPAASPVEAAEVAPPGFLNVRLRPDALAAMIDGIRAEPEA